MADARHTKSDAVRAEDIYTITVWLDRRKKPDPKTQEARATIKRTLAKWEIGRVLTKGKEATGGHDTHQTPPDHTTRD